MSHRNGQQVCCGEEDHAAQSQAHSRNRVYNGRCQWFFFFLPPGVCQYLQRKPDDWRFFAHMDRAKTHSLRWFVLFHAHVLPLLGLLTGLYVGVRLLHWEVSRR